MGAYSRGERRERPWDAARPSIQTDCSYEHELPSLIYTHRAQLPNLGRTPTERLLLSSSGGPGGAACGSSLERGRPSSLQVAGLPSR